MKICGIIAEYNPFHSGHFFHIQETRKITNCDYIVCLLSGSFTQRGEPAIFDKWQRAKAAIVGGADLVLELPTYFATASAEMFSYGAVKIFDNLGVDCISFGSEHDDIDSLYEIANILVSEPKDYKAMLKKELSCGVSFPTARTNALVKYTKDKDIEKIINGSNSILAIEYIKALISLKSEIDPHTVKRIGSDYNDKSMTQKLSSATAIRKHIFEHGFDEKLCANMPYEVFEHFESVCMQGFVPTKAESFFDKLVFSIRRYDKSKLSDISDVVEGLENRIKSAEIASQSYEELVSNIKTKRFTRTRVQRVLNNILLDIKKQDFDCAKTADINKIKVLAFKKESSKLLSHFSHNKKTQLIHSSCDAKDDFFIGKDILCTDVYSSNQKSYDHYRSSQDHTTKTINL